VTIGSDFSWWKDDYMEFYFNLDKRRMAEEGEGVSLPETNKREQSTETKEAVRTMKRKKKHHGMEL